MQSTATAPAKNKKITVVPIEAVMPNPDNPRTVNEKEFQTLVRSLIRFPKMMQLRGIVVDRNMTAVGGNQRLSGIIHIIDMPEDELREILSGHQYEQESLATWLQIRSTKEVPANWIMDGSMLSPEELKEFIVKDNLSAGQFDFDALASQYGNADLVDWGLIEQQIQEAKRESERFITDSASNDDNDEPSAPTGSSEGYTTFTIVIPVSLNEHITRVINRVKQEKKITTVSECLTEILTHYESSQS